MCYLDTSVLAAYYCPEPLSHKIQTFLGQQNKLVISSLTEVEFFSAVSRKVRMGEIEKPDGNRILAKFTAHAETGIFTMISVENKHWRLARGWISLFSTPLKTLDALHLAIASAENLQLVTSDKPLYQAAASLDVNVYKLS
ncbi:MAG: type II toxin-antitoxin system VapC family toxin [Desulfobacterales bacterium]|nr:type II toxin-antitoxin system VapC family toxin [Desulfobacterales bacterium]